MDDVEAKRVFDGRSGGAELVVAAAPGVLSVSVAADRVGRYSLVHSCAPTDVASLRGHVAVATDEDVLLREPGAGEFEATEFGPATAVGFVDGEIVAAATGGRVARLDPRDDDRSWSEIGRLDGTVRAIDGRLLAATAGVYRLPGLDYAGLDDVHDVAAAGPLAATGDGLYSLGNGWMAERDGDFRVAASDGARAHAATGAGFFERVDSEWRRVAPPVDSPVADVAYGTVPYAVSVGGVVLAGEEDGWRANRLGVEDVVGCAVV